MLGKSGSDEGDQLETEEKSFSRANDSQSQLNSSDLQSVSSVLSFMAKKRKTGSKKVNTKIKKTENLSNTVVSDE